MYGRKGWIKPDARGFIDGLIEGVVVHRDGRPIDCNERFEDLTGYALHELRDIYLPDLIVGEKERTECIERIARHDRGSYEFSIRRKTGEVIPVMVAPSEIEFEGAPVRIVGLLDLRPLRASESALQMANQTVANALFATVASLGTALESKDPYTAGHHVQVAEISKAIAIKMELPLSDQEDIYLGALIHDIGKIGVPVEILAKPGRLTGDEKALIRRHPRIGQRIASGIPFSQTVHDIVIHHHERNDSSGYPHHLPGDEIRPTTGIVALADTLDAMLSIRPYHRGCSLPDGIAELGKIRQKYHDGAFRALLDLFDSGHLKNVIARARESAMRIRTRQDLGEIAAAVSPGAGT